jgi:simple sugar transport system permease protein
VSKPKINTKYIPVLATLVVFVLIYLFGAIRYADKNFVSLYNANSVLQGWAVIGVAAIGMTFIILSGGIDLSVGSVIAFTTIFVAATVAPQFGTDCWHGPHPDDGSLCHAIHGPAWHPLLAIAVVLMIGAAFGAAQGCLIYVYGLPPFLVTLAGMFFARGMAFVVHAQSAPIEHGFYTQTVFNDLTINPVGDIYVAPQTLIMFACFALAIFVAHFTRFGREVYAIGGDEGSARLMGVNIGKTKVGVYAIGGLTGALAGVLCTFERMQGIPDQFVGYELLAIAAVVIGGTLLTGGIGLVVGTLMGTVILGLIDIVIINENLGSAWTSITTGALLLLFILLQTFIVRLTRPNCAAE